MSSSGDEPLLEGVTSPPLPSRKRKIASENATSQEEKKSSKRRKLKKPKDLDDTALDADLGINHALAHMDPSLLSDHIAQRTKRFLPELSLVEMEKLHVPEKRIKDTTTFAQLRTKENLPDFLRQFSAPRRNSKKKGQTLSDSPVEKGSPHTLIISGSGLRAADLTRTLRVFQTKESYIAKLFAKHIKFKEAVATVQKTRMGIGVGTPQRIQDLLEEGALRAEKLERVVVDGSFIDVKKRGVLDMKEMVPALVRLLGREELRGVEVVVF